MMESWNWELVADRLALALGDAEEALRLEQAVYGLDAKDERQLQALLAEGLSPHYCVSREVHYPSSAANKRTHRQRCDLVITPPGRPLKLDWSPPGLFDPPDPCLPAEALWLEVKCAYQFREGHQRHTGYGQQWRSAIVEDLKKMEAEPLIKKAGLVLIVFNETRDILGKDLELFEEVLIQKEVLAATRIVRSTDIWERNGHRLCTCVLWPTIQRR